MIPYLINATIIWLVSLLAFQLFLRRNTFHSLNRAYLIATALMGLLLPLNRITPKLATVAPFVQTPMLATAEIQHRIAQQTALPQWSFPWMTMLLTVYGLGVVWNLALLVREATTLLRWYRRAKKQSLGMVRLAVTNEDHSPFSILNTIFISNPSNYSEQELGYIIQHEQVHITRLHSADKLLMLLLRVAFWWHPLIYVYYSRLMEVHEFEADDVARTQPEEYGQFLIDQGLHSNTIRLGHLFFHSPLKNRIKMLTAQRTRNWRKIAYAITVPLIAASAVLWVNNTDAQKRVKDGNIVTFGKNRFEMGVFADGYWRPETQYRLDLNLSYDGNPQHIVQAIPQPIKMNGEPIYGRNELTVLPQMKASEKSLTAELAKDAERQISKLPDGDYDFSVSDVVVDKTGSITYYDIRPLRWFGGTIHVSGPDGFKKLSEESKRREAEHPMNVQLQKEILEAMEKSIEGLVVRPGKKGSEVVISRGDNLANPIASTVVTVKNHKVTIKQ
jgi:hypothetical protein